MQYDPYSGVSSWQAWNRTPGTAKGTYEQWMQSDNGNSAWQNYLDQSGRTNIQNQATQMYDPQRQASNQSLKAALADKGLMGSTGAIGAVSQNDASWVQLIKEWADQRFLADRGFNEDRRRYDTTTNNAQTQAGITNAMQLWELLQSGALAKQQVQGDNRGIEYPNQIPLFADLFKTRFVAPTASSGPVGDPKENTVSMYSDPFRKTLAGQQEDRVAADADADRALSSARLDFDKQQYSDALSRADDESDPWSLMAQDARENRMVGLTTPGANLFPTKLIESWKAEFGVDLVAELKGPNAGRAEALIRSMYGDQEVADAVIARLKGGGGGSVASAAMTRLNTAPQTPATKPVNYAAFGTDDKLFGLPVQGVTPGYEDKPGFLQWLTRKIFDQNY